MSGFSGFVRSICARKRVVLIILFTLIVACVCGYKYVLWRNEAKHIGALSWLVADKLIVIDPGHGGDDPGALGSGSMHEKDIVLSVAKKLASVLREAGTKTLLTRDRDRELTTSDDSDLYSAEKIQELSARVELANKQGADIFISIHVNSFPDPQENGAQTFYQPGSEEGEKLGMAVQQELNRHLANPGREAKPVDYFITRTTEMPSVIVEIGFITNPQEEKLLLDQHYQKKIAWAIYAGIVRYFAQSESAVTLPQEQDILDYIENI